jgi:hypothetical protein
MDVLLQEHLNKVPLLFQKKEPTCRVRNSDVLDGRVPSTFFTGNKSRQASLAARISCGKYAQNILIILAHGSPLQNT